MAQDLSFLDRLWHTDWERLLWHEWGSVTRVSPFTGALIFLSLPVIIVAISIVAGLMKERERRRDKEV